MKNNKVEITSKDNYGGIYCSTQSDSGLTLGLVGRLCNVH